MLQDRRQCNKSQNFLPEASWVDLPGQQWDRGMFVKEDSGHTVYVKIESPWQPAKGGEKEKNKASGTYVTSVTCSHRLRANSFEKGFAVRIDLPVELRRRRGHPLTWDRLERGTAQVNPGFDPEMTEWYLSQAKQLESKE